MSVFLLLQWSEAITHSEVPKLRGSPGAWVWGFWVSDAPVKLSWLKEWARGTQVELQEEGTGTLCSPSCEGAPKGQEQLLWLKVPSSFQTWSLAGDWGIVRLVHWNLPVSLSTCHKQRDRAAQCQGRGFPLGSWALPLHRKYMAVFGVSSVPPVPAPEESRDHSCCVQGWQGCSWHSACAQHALHWPLSPVPPQEVSLLACVTNWAGKARPACAAAPAGLGTQPAPLEMPPGTSCFCLGLSKVENKP